MSENLIFYAGKKAFSKIRENGLNPDDVKVIAGAAGGPKWLILAHLDRTVFGSWFKNRTEPLFLIGSSAGAWRFACASQNDPVSATDRFQDVYIRQSYTLKPPSEEITLEANHIQNKILGEKGTKEILNHPYLRLNIMTVRCKGLTSREEKFLQITGLVTAALCNGIRRKWLGLFFERSLFYDSRNIPPFFDMDEFSIQKIPLNKENIKTALLASGSIPLVMCGVKNIPDAVPGMYRDGGVTDYHINIPFLKSEGIVLFPHYTDKIIPGWLDKKLFWRKPNPLYMKNMLIIAPSETFLNRLPYHKIPDRNDFRRFKGNDRERMAYWNKAVDLSRVLADEFTNAVESGKIKEKIKIIRN